MADQRHVYRHLWRQTLARLLLTYLTPLLLLTAAFHFQYRDMVEESRRQRLMSIAENQAGTLELFLRERLVNLRNIIDDPKLPPAPSTRTTEEVLARLHRDSTAFVDLGFFDSSGHMMSYAGPYPSLLERGYGSEKWFVSLAEPDRRFVITDMYLGFRQRPHFTIAVRRTGEGEPMAIRATLDPERIAEYIIALKGAGEVHSVLVNAAGSYQTVHLPAALVENESVLVPPHDPILGAATYRSGSTCVQYGYCWLGLTDWALIALWTKVEHPSLLAGLSASLVVISAAVILALFSTILIRAGQVVRKMKEEDRQKHELSGQLRHAARLASVGELAAGVAHEINNPLAIIAEEAGLMRDMLDPQFGLKLEEEEIGEHLENIRAAVFRARDITRKLLSFVRKGDVTLAKLDVNQVLEELLAGMFEREMSSNNIEVVRRYAAELPAVLADRGQIEQVLVNLITNAIDAMPGGGRLEVSTAASSETVRIAVADAGAGIPPDQMERIFMPFHTTKEVGKGTGLGLSVSSGIVESYGGEIVVDSEVGVGSTFTVVLPVQSAEHAPMQ